MRTVQIGPESIPEGYESVAPGDSVEQLRALASAVVASPGWPDDGKAVVSLDPGPLLLLTANFDEAQSASLAAWAIELSHTRVRYLDYPEIEHAVELLAAGLRSSIPDLNEWNFAGVPRGGLIVMGMLSYALDLRRDQIVGTDESVDRLVLVDDCAISGLRLSEFLARTSAPRLAIATLYSLPPLRSAILSAHRRVVSFDSAEDLPDLTGRFGQKPQPQAQTSPDEHGVSWVGVTEHLAFPWSEPDVMVSDSRGVAGPAWRLVPPDRCLKNRRAGTEPSPVTTFTRNTGPIQQGDGVIDFHGSDGPVIVDTSTGRTLELTGTAAAMWTALLDSGTVEDAAESLTSRYEVARDTLEADLRGFLRRMTAEGLLRVAGDQAT